MKKEEKLAIIDQITEQINAYPHFYITDISGLNAAQTSNLRRECFKNDIQLRVAKNTLLKLALEKSNKENVEPIFEALKNSSSIMFTEVGNAPAKLIKKLRKTDADKPQLKGAYVEEAVYLGDDQLELLTTIKSKNELIADLIALLQSPAKNVVSALQSGGNILTGVLKTLGERQQ